MEAIDMELKSFNVENLKNYLKTKIDFQGVYTDDVVCEMLEQNVMSRLLMFTVYRNLVFWAEEDYVETEWKDMISLHYINTSYSTLPNVIRVHLFSQKEKFSNDTYLGFFTLRKINELNMLLSYIYPNLPILRKWNNKKNNKEKYFLIFYSRKVHVNGYEFDMCTFPMFVQDGTVACCAHASMLSMIKYLHNKCHFPSLSLKDINNEYTFERTKNFPTKGLGYHQIVEVFSRKGIYVLSETISSEFGDNKEKGVWDIENKVKQFIDSNIESGLPVMILGEFVLRRETKSLLEHSILIIGHTMNNKGIKEYLIYDDSGALLQEACQHKNIIGTMSWEELMDICIHANVLFPQYERVYLNCEDIRKRLGFNQLESKSNIQTEQALVSELVKYESKFRNIRFIILDNARVKKLLRGIFNEEDELLKKNKEEIKNILVKNLSHYVWYCELEIVPGLYFVYLADPTYNNDTMINVFINKQALIVYQQLCVLLPQGEKKYMSESVLCDAVFGIKNAQYDK